MNKKHTCPYLDSLENCTHKMQNLGQHKGLVKCPYNNPNKCRWYNQTKTELKATRELKNLPKGVMR